MIPSIRKSGCFPYQKRMFAITSIRDVRPGQVLKFQGKLDSSPIQYWRINDLNLVKQKQEGVASCIAVIDRKVSYRSWNICFSGPDNVLANLSQYITYLNLTTMKNGKWKAQMKERVDVVELEMKNCQVLYYDDDARILFVNDEDFNQIEIPLRLIKGAEKLLQAGDSIGVGMDEEVIVQISLPGGVIQQIRSIGVDDHDEGDK